MSPAEEAEFIVNVKVLAENGTLAELLRRIEQDAIEDWKIAANAEAREACHATLRAIDALTSKIKSLSKADEVKAFNNRRRFVAGDTFYFDRSQ